MKNKNCEGCNAQWDNCSSHYNNDCSCPCVDCVVKVICTYYCEKWTKWEYAEWCEANGTNSELIQD